MEIWYLIKKDGEWVHVDHDTFNEYDGEKKTVIQKFPWPLR